MDVNAKIKLIAETITGYNVIVDTSNGANVELDKTAMPCILIFIQDNGEYLATNSHYRDSVNVRVAFLNLMPKGFKESDVESMRYTLKQDMILLYHKLKYDFQFKINSDFVKYEIVYDEMDANLLGVVFSDSIKERVGINLSCETPDSIGAIPSAMSFCEKVSECSSIISINQMLADLQYQIDNLPLPPPALKGHIKITDLNGELFSDQLSARAYVEQFYTGGSITDEIFQDGVYYFSVPPNSDFGAADYFLGSATDPVNVSIEDELGLIVKLNMYAFFYNTGNIYLGNVDFGNFPTGASVMTSYAFGFFTGFASLGNFTPNINFARFATGKFILRGEILLATGNQFFFRFASSTIYATKEQFTINSGSIQADLQQAIGFGCNVFFDGIDKENILNKATDFLTPDNITYPTTQATKNLVDYYIQSNIKVIGDWDATIGAYPLNDESNTTPFITQWGNTIKQGWAFRVGYGQAGTVHGFDYENGDVVYSLVDNPTDNPADWGDLDHNLQQANESLRGTAKVITAAIISDETTLDDERFVTGKKLWANFWQRVLALAWTWNAKQTHTASPRFNSAGATHYLKTNATKDLTSSATIPATDISTDSTHRFITDAQLSNLGNQSNTNTGDETAARISAINHGTAAKVTIVDSDELTGQDSANSFSLIKVTALNLYNYYKSKLDLIYVSVQTISITSSATPAVNTGTFILTNVTITAQAVPITSMSSSLTGTPPNFGRLIYRIKTSGGTAQPIVWGVLFTGSLLPSTTVVNQVLTVGLMWDSVTGVYRCLAVDSQNY